MRGFQFPIFKLLINHQLKMENRLGHFKARQLALFLLVLMLSFLPKEVESVATVTVYPLDGRPDITNILHIDLNAGLTINQGDVFVITIPSPAYINSTAPEVCSPINNNSMTIASCSVESNKITMGVSVVDGQQPTSYSFQLLFFVNPRSTAPIPGFTLEIINAQGASQTIIAGEINRFTSAKLTAASVVPQSQQIGALDQTLRVSLTIKDNSTILPTDKIFVYFPLWNPESGDNAVHQISSETPDCSIVTGLTGAIYCAYDQTKQYLTLIDLVTAPTKGPLTMTFDVNSFRNPYNGKPQHGYSIFTADSSDYQIDSSDAASIDLYIQVSTWATFSTASLTRADTVTSVGEASSLVFSLQLDLPTDQKCRVAIAGPSDMPLDSANSKTMTIYTGPQNAVSFTNALLPSGLTFFAGDFCSSYAESYNQIITLNKVKNRLSVRDTGSFTVYILAYTVSGSTITYYPIASVNTGVSFTADQFTIGSINSLKVVAVDSTVVGNNTKYQFTIQPQHSMPSSSAIQIVIPTTIKFNDTASCLLLNVTKGASASAQCSITSNTITIINPFGAIGTYTAGGAAFSFIISTSGTNPIYSTDSGAFQVSTFEVSGETRYPIDDKTFSSGIYKPTSDGLRVEMSQSSTLANDVNVMFNFTVSPRADIPIGSVINITFPKDIQIPKVAQPMINCTTSMLNKVEVQTFLTATRTNTSLPFTILITNVFVVDPFNAFGTSFVVSCVGFQNPRGDGTYVTPVAMRIQTSPTAVIEQTNSAGQIIITDLPSIQAFNIVPTSLVNGERTSYTVSITPSIDMISTDNVLITFPPELTLPIVSKLTCSSSTGVSSITGCSISGANKVRTVFTFVNGVAPAGITFKYVITGVRNPNSTMPSSAFPAVETQTSATTGYRRTQTLSNTNVIVQTTTFSTIVASVLSVEQNNTVLNTTAIYTLNFQSNNPIPVGGSFQVQYWPMITAPLPGDTFEFCQFISGKAYTMKCSVNQTANIITMTGLTNTVPFLPGTPFSIKLSPMVNSPTQKNPQSFQIRTYTNDQQQYSIDQAVAGLFPSFSCDYPCETCSAFSRSRCLSCQSFVEGAPYKYLSGSNCIAACPNGTSSIVDEVDTFVCQVITVDFRATFKSASSSEANFEPVSYTISVRPILSVPTGSTLAVTFPSEVSLATNVTTVKCELTVGTSVLSETVTPSVTVPNIIAKFASFFNTAKTAGSKTEFNITCFGFKNPRSLGAQPPFQVTITDGSSSLTYKNPLYLTFSISNIPSFSAFTLVSTSLVVGQITSFVVTMTPGIELRQSEYVMFSVPTDIKLPAQLNCYPGSNQLQLVTCSHLGSGKVKAEFLFTGLGKSGAAEEIKFTIKNVRNPPTTQPRNVSAIAVYNANGGQILKFGGTYPAITATQPASVITRQLILGDSQQNAETTFTIKFRNVNPLPVASTFSIIYPSSVEVTDITTCTVTVNSISYLMACDHDSTNSRIKVSSANVTNDQWLNSPVPQGSTIQVTVGTIRNQAASNNRNGFTLTTYENLSQAFSIDQVTADGLKLISCPLGKYAEKSVCVDCFDGCLTCSDRNSCTSCDEGAAENNYLYQGKCWTKIYAPGR